MRALFGRRSPKKKGLALVPALVALLFSGPAWEDAGVQAAVLYFSLALLSGLYFLRPTVAGWVPLFAAFATYSILVASKPDLSQLGEWLLFLSFGLAPTIALWVARPCALQTGGEASQA